jgi:signal transduction histidine kinase
MMTSQQSIPTGTTDVHENDAAFDGDALLEEGVAIEQLELYCRYVASTLISSTVVSLGLVYFFWGHVSSVPLLAWLVFQVSVSLLRFLTIRVFRRRGDAPANITSWRNRMVLGAFLAGAGWGMGNVLFYQAAEVDYRILVACTLPAVCAIAAGTLSALPHAFPAFMFPMMVPFLLVNIHQHTLLGYGLATLGMLFIVTLLPMSHRMLTTMTDSLRLSHQNRLLREMADAASHAKSDFLSSVSHELRTPMTSVFGFSKLIKKKMEQDILPCLDRNDSKAVRSAEQIQTNLDVIISEGERLTKLINDVLDLAKLDAGRMEWDFHPVDLSGIIEHAAAATAPLAQGKGLRLALDVEKDLPVIPGDRDRLVQVLVNLVSNAVKFTGQGAITIVARLCQTVIEVGVVDTGIGISEENVEKVFDKFHQIGDTLTDKPHGTGLGLAICKEIINRHGGSIWVESELGKGSAFRFTLPVSQQASGQ